jgi:hypothetical protein
MWNMWYGYKSATTRSQSPSSVGEETKRMMAAASFKAWCRSRRALGGPLVARIVTVLRTCGGTRLAVGQVAAAFVAACKDATGNLVRRDTCTSGGPGCCFQVGWCLAGVCNAVHEHGEDAGRVEVSEPGEDSVSAPFGVPHLALGVPCGDLQPAVLGAKDLDRVRAEIGPVGARSANVGAGAAVGVAVRGGRSLSCVSVGGVARARERDRVSGPAAAEVAAPRRELVGSPASGGSIAAAADAAAGPLGREHMPGACEEVPSARGSGASVRSVFSSCRASAGTPRN